MKTFFNSLIFLCICTLSSISSAESISVLSQDTFIEKKDSANWLILDVRSIEEFSAGHIANAVNIPYTEVPNKLAAIKKYQDKGIVVYCRSGRRAGIALNFLEKEGVTNLYHLSGDMIEWEANNRPIEK